jgi:hypothetical protein
MSLKNSMKYFKRCLDYTTRAAAAVLGTVCNQMEQICFAIISTVIVVILSRLFVREKREYGFPEVRKRGKKRC